MNISLWDHLRERYSEKLTHTQRTIRHGIVTFLAISSGACLKMPIDAWLGNDVKPEQSLVFVGTGAVVGVVYTVIDLVRGPQPTHAPDLHLTAEMSRRIR